MTSIHDTQLGELSLEDGEYQTTLELGGRKVSFSLYIDDVSRLPVPIDLVPVPLSDLLARALARARSNDDDAVQTYIEHHLGELTDEQWSGVLPDGTEPTDESARNAVQLRRIWGSLDEEGLELSLDHGLPESLTDYVLAVSVGATGAIEDVAMES